MSKLKKQKGTLGLNIPEYDQPMYTDTLLLHGRHYDQTQMSDTMNSNIYLASGFKDQVLKSNGLGKIPSWKNGTTYVGYSKGDDDQPTGNIVTFKPTPIVSGGDVFGTMADTGVFTFSLTGVYSVVFSFNVSNNPDGWGIVSGDEKRYVQHRNTIKGSTSDVITVPSVGTTFHIFELYNPVVNSGTRLYFTKLS